MYGYYRQKLHVNHFWELKVNTTTCNGREQNCSFPVTKHLRSDFWSVENSSASAQQTRVTTPGCFCSRAKCFVVLAKAVFTFTHVSYTARKILFQCRGEFLELYAEDGYNC